MIRECMMLLKKYRQFLTRQQVTTLKGQIMKGDFSGFRKGLDTLLNRKVDEFYGEATQGD